MTDTIIPVILSGGSGTRLWPVSTPAHPKQFLALSGETTMFAQTIARVADRDRFAAPLIVGAERHAHLIENELDQAGSTDAQILLEPMARNTAPAIALAAFVSKPADALMLVMPSDHVIENPAAFLAAVATATPAARQGWLVTFGIAPTGPETGFGYIQMGKAVADGQTVSRVERFIEKPERGKAEAMLAAGDHVWNAGIFLMRCDRYLEEIGRHAPAMLRACATAIDSAAREGRTIYPDSDAFAACPSDSIDYAVMERADRVAVVAVDCGWSDLGSWDALAELGAADDKGNRLKGDVIALESENCLIRAQDIGVAVSGLDNLIVIATPNHVMIVPRGRSQDVKAIVDGIAKATS